MAGLLCLFFVLILIVISLSAVIRRNKLAGTSVVRVCLTAMFIAVVVGPVVGAVLWVCDLLVIHNHMDAYSSWSERILAWRAYTTFGALAGSFVALLWGVITVLTSLGGRKP